MEALLRNKPMESESLKERINLITQKRQMLVDLLEKPDVGTLRIDINQALEEMDDLIDEFNQTFPGAG